MVLVFTEYGYGHVDLTKHGADLEKPNELVEQILAQFNENKEEKEEKEESKDEKPKLVIPEKFDSINFTELKDLQPHISSEKYDELQTMFNKIIRVQFLNGAIGGVRRRNISTKITLRVKTLHGKRPTYPVEVSIFDKVEVVIDKLLKIE